MMAIKRIAIGPELNTPSWNWVGFDLSRELSKHYAVEIFQNQIPDCDVVILVKQPVERVEATRPCKIIYLPIDHYENTDQIRKDRGFLKMCSAIGCHSESQIPYFQSSCPIAFFMEHHGRYTLPQLRSYKRDGFVLWVGGMQHLPFLLRWLEVHPLTQSIKIVTNYSDQSARRAFSILAEQLQVPTQIRASTLGGHQLFEWSERVQHTMMLEARAALDIKAGSWLGRYNWGQYMKPPTKAQKYVSSGIPFAANMDSYSFDYFKRRGFTLATPDNEERWLSFEYWSETVKFGAILRRTTSLERVGFSLGQIIDSL